MERVSIRNAEPSDYQAVIAVVNDWWGGRNMRDMLPKLFFIHFRPTAFVAETCDKLVGFLAGIVSQTIPQEAYIHFVGVHPDFRRQGVGCALYQRFFSVVGPLGCKTVRCVTGPVNRASVAFHLRMGFAVEPTETCSDGLYIAKDYDGCGIDRVLFLKPLQAGT